MQVWSVIYKPALFTNDLYERGLSVVDSESEARIKKFYHRADSCRTLIGRLLVRVMLKERGVLVEAMQFSATSTGKPYLTTQTIDPPIAYNITHDNNLVAMAFAPGIQNPPAFSIGIDVMKIRIPGRDTFESFVNIVKDQLTLLEHQQLKAILPQTELLKRFFWMWTLKEAYTKALGLGLGFDFQRIEFDVVEMLVRVDGSIPEGWRFNMFVLTDEDDLYQGVVAEYIGGIQTQVIRVVDKPDWLKTFDSLSFTDNAVGVLKS